MGKISKNIKVITFGTYYNFKSTLDKKQAFSIFEAFQNADKYDENGNESKHGDNQLTGDEVEVFFRAIDDDLKQKFLKMLEVEEIANCLRYSNSEFEPNQYNKQKYDKAIKSINVDNIESIIFNSKRSDKVYEFVHQLEHPYFKNNGNPRNMKEIDSDCKRIRKVLQQWCKKHGIDTSELDKKKIETLYGYTDSNTGEYVKFDEPLYDSENLIRQYVELMNDYRNNETVKKAMTNDVRDEMQKAIQKRYDEALKNNEELTTDNPSQTEDQKKLQKTVNQSKKMAELLKDDPKFSEHLKSTQQNIKESEIFLNDSGNGKFDRAAMQLTGNCWLLGGINALISTEFGKEFLERNIIKDEEKHIFAVHLQEAEDMGFPKPNGDGIFVFTEKEVLDAQNTDTGLASGEGDIVAFALAVDKYIKEKSKGAESSGDGNTDYRLFEVVTGLSKRNFENSKTGIQYKTAADIGDGETRLNYFDEIFEMAKNQTGATTLGLKGHEFSVIGVEGDCLLIQESNNMATYSEKFELIKDSFPPAYKVPKELFEKTFTSYSSITWGK